MAETPFDNIYDLTTEQLEKLDEAEDLMLKNDLGAAERMLLEMLKAVSYTHLTLPTNHPV